MNAAAHREQGEASARTGLIRAGIVLTVAVGVANALNAVFQFALARILEPDEYALLAALLAVVIVAAIPPLALQATTAREVSARLARGDREGAGAYVKGMAASVLRWAGGLSVIAVLVLLPAALMDVADPLAYSATVATVAFALGIPVIWGGLQGIGRFSYLSGMHVLFAGSRLAVGLGIAAAGGSVGAVMCGVAVATVVTELVSILPIRPMLPPGMPKLERLASRLNAVAALGLTALWALIYGDLLVARIVFSGDEAGAYAAAAVASKVLLLVPIAATTVLFPRVAVLEDRARERRHLLTGLAVVAGASSLLTAVAWSLADPLIELAFGAEYEAGADWLGPLSLAMALYGLAIVYLYHFLSLSRARFAGALVGLLLAQIAAYALFHGSPEELVGVQIAFGLAVAAAGEAWYLTRHR